MQRVRVNRIDSNRLFRGQCEHSCSSCQLAETLSGRENEAQLNGGFKNSDILLGLSFGNFSVFHSFRGVALKFQYSFGCYQSEVSPLRSQQFLMTSSLRYQFLGASLSTFGMTYMRSPAIDVDTTRGPFSMFGLCASSQLAYSVKMTLASNCQPASKYIQKIPKESKNI